MSLQEWAVAIGLLTPLVLGILAFIEKLLNKKRDEPDEDEPAIVQGMTVVTNSYADQLITELQREVLETKQQNEVLKARLNERNGNGG